MEIDSYQKRAKSTRSYETKHVEIPFLGLAGEAGALIAEYKKFVRDKGSPKHFKEILSEELGDLLWYISEIASKYDLSLEDVALKNLEKNKLRWLDDYNFDILSKTNDWFFDDDFPEEEKLPRLFFLNFRNKPTGDKIDEPCTYMTINGKVIGDILYDNNHIEDGYRFHDVFHISFAVNLGWSPVLRSLFKCKRSSVTKIMEVEDGGRAAAIEEGIVAQVFSYGSKKDFLIDAASVEYPLLKRIMEMTDHLEVKNRSYYDWQKAILDGFKFWNLINTHLGGSLDCNLNERIINYHNDLSKKIVK